jgi:hypothetical protein
MALFLYRVELTGHLPVKNRDAQKHDGRLSANMVYSPKKLADAAITARRVSMYLLVLLDAPVKDHGWEFPMTPLLGTKQRSMKNLSVIPTACASLFTAYFLRRLSQRPVFKRIQRQSMHFLFSCTHQAGSLDVQRCEVSGQHSTNQVSDDQVKWGSGRASDRRLTLTSKTGALSF